MIPRASSLVVPALVGVLLCGCLMQPHYSVAVTTADGVRLEVPLNSMMPVVNDEVITINRFRFTPWKVDTGKGLAFSYELAPVKGTRVATVTIDDVSDTPIEPIVTEQKPAFSPAGLASGISPAYLPSEGPARWLSTLDNTVRVYRFKVKLEDGSLHTLYWPLFVPNGVKAFMRTELGIS